MIKIFGKLFGIVYGCMIGDDGISKEDVNKIRELLLVHDKYIPRWYTPENRMEVLKAIDKAIKSCDIVLSSGWCYMMKLSELKDDLYKLSAKLPYNNTEDIMKYLKQKK